MKGKADTTGAVENGGGYALIPDGEYTARIVEVADGSTKGGDPMITITLEIHSVGPEGGRKVWDRIVIPKQGSPAFGIMGRTMHFLHCIGEPYEGTFTWNSDNWQGQVVKVEIGSREYNGKEYNEVRNYILEEKPPKDDKGIPF
jgi:hypothetical protein